MLTHVVISSTVLEVCWYHALTNEKEEMMGVLIGQKKGSGVNFYTLKAIKRMTKQKDRVEIDDSQLVEASTFAASLEGENSEPLCVLGWYHSHPHITVPPSHVDLRTQHSYQAMDPCFVGLIFSVYNSNPATMVETRDLVAFQAELDLEGELIQRTIEIRVDKGLSLLSERIFLSVYESLKNIAIIFLQEEMDEFTKNEKSGIRRCQMTSLANKGLLTARLLMQHLICAQPVLEQLQLKRLIGAAERPSDANGFDSVKARQRASRAHHGKEKANGVSGTSSRGLEDVDVVHRKEEAVLRPVLTPVRGQKRSCQTLPTTVSDPVILRLNGGSVRNQDSPAGKTSVGDSRSDPALVEKHTPVTMC